MELISPEEFKKGKRAGSPSLPTGTFEFISPDEFKKTKAKQEREERERRPQTQLAKMTLSTPDPMASMETMVGRPPQEKPNARGLVAESLTRPISATQGLQNLPKTAQPLGEAVMAPYDPSVHGKPLTKKQQKEMDKRLNQSLREGVGRSVAERILEYPAEALERFVDAASIGLISRNNLNVPERAEHEQSLAGLAGEMAGYIVPGVAVERAAAAGLKPVIGGLSRPAQRAITGAVAGTSDVAAQEAGDALFRGETFDPLNVAFGAGIGAGANVAIPAAIGAVQRGITALRQRPLRNAVNQLVENIERPRGETEFVPHPKDRVTPQGTMERTVPAPSQPVVQNVPRPSVQSNVQAMAMTSDGRPLLPAASEVGTTVGKNVTKRSNIIADLSKGLGITIRTGRFREPAHGIFKVREGVVRTKLTNDLPVISHEVGHALDKRYWLSSSLYDDELLKLGRTTSGPEYTRDQIRSEGVAEFFRLMLTDPMEAQTRAPRFFARYNELVSPHDKSVIANAQKQIRQYLDQDLINRSYSELSVGQKDKKKLPTLSDIYTKFVDEINPINKLLKPLGDKGKEIYEAFWLLRGVTGRAQAFLFLGRVNRQFQRAGKSFDEILSPVKKNLDEFRTYIKERRAVELARRKIMTGSDLSEADRRRVIQSLEAQFPHFREAHRELLEYQDSILQELIDSGVLSPKDVARFKADNKEYVPFFRVYEAEAGAGAHRGGRTSTQSDGSPIKRIKGSDRDIIDPLESIIRNTYQYITIAERNRALLSLVDGVTSANNLGNLVEKIPTPMRAQSFSLGELRKTLEKAGAKTDEIDMDTIVSIFRPQNVAPGKDNVISVFRNGKREFYQLDPDLYRAVTAADREQMNAIIKAMNFPVRLLRSGVVNTMEFWFKNMFRDQFAAMVNSRNGYIPYIDLIRGMWHVLRKDDTFMQFMAAGGAQGLRQSLDRRYLQHDLRKILTTSMRDKTMNVIKNPIEAMNALSELSEMGTRVGEFAKGVRKDSSREGIRKAALSARDLIDFGRAGTIGKHINKVSAFWNANLQGLDRMIRTFSDPKLAPKAFAKSLAVITGPTWWLYEKNKHDPRYQELPQWDKDLFWHFWVGDTHFRVPIPFELGVVFKVLPERIMNMADEQDGAWRGFGDTVAEQLPVPTNIPDLLGFVTAFSPFAEISANRSFSGAPIVPMYQQNELPEDQYGPYTSETAKLIARGAAAVGLDETFAGSPRKLDHVVTGYGGSLGRYALQSADAALEALGAVERTPTPATGLEDKPGFKAVLGRPFGGTTDSIDKFYERIDELTEQKKRAEKKGEFFEHAGELKRLEQLKKSIGDIGRQIRNITNDKNMSPEEKRNQIRRLEVIRNNLARVGLGLDQLQYEELFGDAE